MMNSGLARLSLYVVLAVLLLSGCGGTAVPMALPPTPAPVQPTLPEPSGLAPEQVVSAFYNWYLEYAGGAGERRNPIVDGAFRATGYLGADLVQRVDAARAVSSLNFDPFLCAQDIPGRISAGPAAVDGAEARVPVTSDFPNHAFSVLLIKATDRWQIADVKCSPPVLAEPAAATRTPAEATTAPQAPDALGQAGVTGWKTYLNAQHGFQIRYPAGWTFTELVADPDQPPIGPANVPVVVHFMPQEWADKLAQKGRPDPSGPVIAPFTLELSIGTLEEYRGSYPGPTESQALSLDGRPAVREEDTLSSEVKVIRYLFTNPADGNQRLTFIDYTSGFAQRLKGNEAVVREFEAMLPTLTWNQP